MRPKADRLPARTGAGWSEGASPHLLQGGSLHADARAVATSTNGTVAPRDRWTRLRAFLPEGRSLPEDVWFRRHRLILGLLLLHVPAIFVFALVRGFGVSHSLLEASLVGLFVVPAIWPARGRKLRAVAATFGILTSSAVLVHISGGTIEAHFHFFVMIGVIALYQDWTPFSFAVGYVLLHHGVAGLLDPSSVYNHVAAQRDPWTWAGIHALFIAGACAVSLFAWRLNEDSRSLTEEYYRRLYEGEHALVQRLEDAQQMKDELVATISHEFRTPITAILGLGRTLLDRGELLTDEDRRDFVERSVRQAERLRLVVENLLQASRVVEPAIDARTDLRVTVARAIEELGDLRDTGAVTVQVDVASGMPIRMSEDALHMIVSNLAGNAGKYAPPGTRIEISATASGSGDVILSVSNEADVMSAADLDRIFEPFVQLDSSLTRAVSGVGLGLHIVRRLAEAHGGGVAADQEGGRVFFRVRLPVAEAEAAAEAHAATG